ncbi:type II toxin-antitoxin system VapC family toxin [Luteococcus sp. H138]|uniref:type II toxin-antitoxin system VapC family toxin n=1 Tax=unclassified Luteococcus TaxID=2639923 RepID=UPI00313E48C9
MTLVLDASAAAEFLLGTEQGLDVGVHMGSHPLIAPQLLAAEVVSILRGWNLSGQLASERVAFALQDFKDLGVQLFDMGELMFPAWKLRHNVSAYDAMYVALAEAFECQVLSCDLKLVRAMPDLVISPA